MLQMYTSKRRRQGFTLIELMIVVAVVAILSAIAYPSYIEAVRRSKRAEARAQLLETAQYMQRFYSQNDRFDVARDGTDASPPSALTRVPRDGAQTYAIGLVAGASSFTLQAVPTGSMSADRCGKLQISSAGRKEIVGATSGVTVAECWR